MPPPLSITAHYPDTHWRDLEILCKRTEYAPGELLTSGQSSNSRWGDGTGWICSVGTVIINTEIAPCTPCQKIEYTCRNTGAQIYQEKFCPVGAKYPDRRLDLIGHYLPAEGSEKDEITTPKKSCPQIRRDTIRFVSALWQKDCTINTDGELKDLLNEAGPHCGTVRYSCPAAEDPLSPKEWNFCAQRMGTWELSMRRFLQGLHPTCTVDGPGRTALWWKYYHSVLMKTDPEAVYGFDITWGKEKGEVVSDETIIQEYQFQKKGRKITRKPLDLMSITQPVFYRNATLPAWSESLGQKTVGGAIAAVCEQVSIVGEYSPYRDTAVQSWVDAASERAVDSLVCPMPELTTH